MHVPGDDATVISGSATPDDATIASASAHSSLSTTSGVGGEPPGRFVPGAVVADRYRIVGLLGRGGMGEVYRADDLQLGQPVALKFLTADLAHDPGRLERFRNEVRTSLKVTHASVCRVYDIGEVQGQHFLSMEFVDGEDLKSLLLRIGRLPQERAVEVGRQICAGLAAAHEQGILHRDLKPANVMLDGRGQVKLTDFGLASLADGVDEADVRAGTPAYQAPEQLRGEEVSKRSDIYALGLVLYELFTGKRVHKAETLAELHDLHASGTPSSLSSYVPELDPAVERAVMRCLEKRPADRPASAIAVSAALPGGDPLAAALAAGETPSPEMVAQAGDRAGMPPLKAFGLALAAVLLAVGVSHWAGSMSLVHYMPLEKRPEVLMDRAQSVLAELGYDEPVYSEPVDQAWGFLLWGEILNEVEAADSTATRWEGLRDRPDAMAFWYRQAPRLFIPNSGQPPILLRGPVRVTNPPATIAGEAAVLLDLDGSLRRLEVMPRRFSLTDEPITEPDWTRLFDLAGLDPDRFTEDRPRYQRFLSPDRRRAWLGTEAHAPDRVLRVEAGSFEGRPVLFNVTTAASLLSLGVVPEPVRPTVAEQIQETSQPLIILLVVVFAVILSRRNMDRGRADTCGASRFGWAMFWLFLVGNGLQTHTLFSYQWASELWPLLSGATFMGIVAWGSYLAAEPLGRRVWPTMFVASNRLLSRARVQWRDPILGHSVLVGMAAGAVTFGVSAPVRRAIQAAMSDVPPRLLGINTDMLQGQREALAVYLDLSTVMILAVVSFLSLVVAQSLVRRRKVALAITVVIWTIVAGPTSGLGLGVGILVAVIGLAVLLRWGALAYVISRLVLVICWETRAADWDAWYAEGAMVGVGLLVLLAVYGWWAATGRGTEPRPNS